MDKDIGKKSKKKPAGASLPVCYILLKIQDQKLATAILCCPNRLVKPSQTLKTANFKQQIFFESEKKQCKFRVTWTLITNLSGPTIQATALPLLP